MRESDLIYILAMAGVTYLVRMLPLVLLKKEIQNRFLRSFLYYVPYACLACMTVPAVFFATTYVAGAAVCFFVALFLSYREKSLIVVALAACAAVFVAERILEWMPL